MTFVQTGQNGAQHAISVIQRYTFFPVSDVGSWVQILKMTMLANKKREFWFERSIMKYADTSLMKGGTIHSIFGNETLTFRA
jgi:hypothetical protein